MMAAARLAIPLLAIALAVIAARVLSPYWLEIAIRGAVFATLAMGLNLLYGYLGLLSFAQVAFWGVGGYTAALLASGLGWTLLPSMAAGAVVAITVGVPVGYAALRLSRHSFAVVTLSLALLAQLVARDWTSLTRGPLGIPGLAVPPLHLPFKLQLDPSDPRDFLIVASVLAVVCLSGVYWLLRGPIGRTFLALKQNEPLAMSQGVAPLPFKLLAIAISAGMTGAAGGLFVFHLSIVDPTIFDFYYTETMLVMVVVGGAGSFWGVLAGVALFSVLPEMLRITPDARMILYGALLVAVVAAMPDGIAGWLARRRSVRRDATQAGTHAAERAAYRAGAQS